MEIFQKRSLLEKYKSQLVNRNGHYQSIEVLKLPVPVFIQGTLFHSLFHNIVCNIFTMNKVLPHIGFDIELNSCGAQCDLTFCYMI